MKKITFSFRSLYVVNKKDKAIVKVVNKHIVKDLMKHLVKWDVCTKQEFDKRIK